MLKMMHARFQRLILQKKMILGIPMAFVLYVLLVSVIDVIVSHQLHLGLVYGDSSLTRYPGFAALVLSCFVSSFMTGDFLDGTIRNQIVIGTKRVHIYLSACVLSGCVALFFQLFYTAVSVIMTYILMDGFMISGFEIVKVTLLYCLAGVSLSIFFTTLVFIFCTSRISILISPGLATAVMVLSMIVMDKLYPSTGTCLLTGMRFKIYTFLDEYVPFFHLLNFPRWAMKDYLIGNISLMGISLLIGILVFRKIDLK